MKILILEPYFADSHRSWAEGFAAHSEHEVSILSLPGRHWKWRMHGAAASFAMQLRDQAPPDLILASEMLDLATFKGLMPASWTSIPSILYFHENQLSYPWSDHDKDPGTGRDYHYAWIHVTGCLAATEVWFNSEFHQSSFLGELGTWLPILPSPTPTPYIDIIREKSRVMPIGLNPDLRGPKPDPSPEVPVFLWNHRWEHDKDPLDFWAALGELKKKGIPFRVILLGKGNNARRNSVVKRLLLDREIMYDAYAETREEYLHWVRQATILPVASRHDFFGISVLEAAACGVFPVVPNKLVYPEHFQDYPDCLYEPGYLNLASRLIKLSRMGVSRTDILREHILRLTWDRVAKQYDAAISRILSEN